MNYSVNRRLLANNDNFLSLFVIVIDFFDFDHDMEGAIQTIEAVGLRDRMKVIVGARR